MSNSTNAVNNVNKIQNTPSSGKKTNVDSKDAALQFEALFSSAIFQLAPNAQLNTIEAQLRESLFKQDNKQKNNYTESNINTEATQSTLWAQRNWMQDSHMAAASQAVTNNRANTTNPTEEVAVLPAPQKSNEINSNYNKSAENGSSEQTATKKAVNNKQPDAMQAAQAPEANQQRTLESTAAIDDNADATAASPATSTIKPASTPTATQEPSAKPFINLNTTPIDAVELVKANTSAEPLSARTSTNSDQYTSIISDQVGLDDKSNNAEVNAILNNNTVTLLPENTAGNKAINNATNANAVVAQLAPQIAQQTANATEQKQLQRIQVDQKLMAGNSLQNPIPSEAITASTNGLNSTSGAQQVLIKSPVTQPGFTKEIGQTVQWAIGKNFSTVDIRVNPETFGPMNMRLVQKGQQVQLIIRTQDEASSNLLTQALSGLKEVLGQQGIQLNQVQIQHNNAPTTNTQTNNSQPQFDQKNNSGRGGQQSARGGHAKPDEPQLQINTPATKPQGKLDLFA